ncbi:hypothetical protein E4U10_003621 [Claviceps purpurea]|nr:hypothetical protein E4U10_003621 [Claviceps purpurea]
MLYRASTTYLYFEIIRENPKCFALSLVFTHLNLKKDKVELKFVIGDRPNYEPPFDAEWNDQTCVPAEGGGLGVLLASVTSG